MEFLYGNDMKNKWSSVYTDPVLNFQGIISREFPLKKALENPEKNSVYCFSLDFPMLFRIHCPFGIGVPLVHFMILIRVKQWVKNTFVFAPLIFTGLFLNHESLLNSFFCFCIFSLAASCTYIFNDIMDYEKDRIHPEKSKIRPIASGAISLLKAKIFLFTGYLFLGLSLFLLPPITPVILLYLITNILYSLYLKHKPVVDIFTISSGFVFRVITGAMAIETPFSGWMLLCTFCLSLFLASVKRMQELKSSGSQGRPVLDNYSLKLIEKYSDISCISALTSYCMYTMSINQPLLVYSIPLVLFGFFRYWFVIENQNLGESPTDVVISDIPLLVTVLIWIGFCAWIFTGV